MSSALTVYQWLSFHLVSRAYKSKFGYPHFIDENRLQLNSDWLKVMAYIHSIAKFKLCLIERYCAFYAFVRGWGMVLFNYYFFNGHIQGFYFFPDTWAF